MAPYLPIVVPGLQLDASIPIPPADSYMDPAGAIVYIDPTHPKAQWADGVPSSVPNLAAPTAAAWTGLAESAFALSIANTITSASGYAGRTSKKALEVVTKRTGAVSGQALLLNITSALQAFMLANKNDVWYVTMRFRVTRGGASAPNIARIGQSSTVFAATITEGSAGTSMVGAPAPNRTTLATPALGRVSAEGSGSAITTAFSQWVLALGPQTAAQASSGVPDLVVYDFYVENRTKSTRTFVQAEAAFAAKDAVTFGTGGRYQGDVYTVPGTIG